MAAARSVQVRTPQAGSRQRQRRLRHHSTTGRPPAGRSRTRTVRRPCSSARSPQPTQPITVGRGLDGELPLATHQLGRDDLEAVQAEQPGGGRTTVLTHLGPPSCRRQTSARYARPQVPFGSLRGRQRHLTTLHDEEPLTIMLRSLNPVGKDAASVAWERWWPSPHPRAGAGVELAGRDRGRQGDLLRGGKRLPGKRLAAMKPPPALLEVAPAGPFGDEHLPDPGVVDQPLAGGDTGVAGEVVGDHDQVAGGVGGLDRG